MKNQPTPNAFRYPRRWLPLLLVVSGLAALLSPRAWGAMTNVSVIDNSFSPASVAINAGDSVKWTWNGLGQHSSTGPGTPPLWDSGLHTNGFTFTNTFNTAGTFAYVCTIHVAIGMTGSVTVQGVANVPPSVAITSPTNGANFAAPWTGTILASASDPDDMVSKVDFYAGPNLLGTVSNPPANLSLHVTNIPAGSYTLTALATDSRGATNASAGVTVHVLTPVAIALSSPLRISPSSFQLLYTATPGLSYVVQRSSGLPAFTPIHTNTATTNRVTYLDANATGDFNVYSVNLLPNP